MELEHVRINLYSNLFADATFLLLLFFFLIYI